MADNPAQHINGTINELMKPVDLNSITEAAIYGTQVYEDSMDEIQAEREAKSLEPEDNPPFDPREGIDETPADDDDGQADD